MRTLRPATNLVLACLAALALLTTLEFPWVSPAVTDPVGRRSDQSEFLKLSEGTGLPPTRARGA